MHPGKVQKRGSKKPPAVLGRGQRAIQKHAWWCRAHGWSMAEWLETQLSNFPRFGQFVFIGALWNVAVWQFSFSFWPQRGSTLLILYECDCVHLFGFRYCWRSLESREEGVSAWQNLSNSTHAKVCTLNICRLDQSTLKFWPAPLLMFRGQGPPQSLAVLQCPIAT